MRNKSLDNSVVSWGHDWCMNCKALAGAYQELLSQQPYCQKLILNPVCTSIHTHTTHNTVGRNKRKKWTVIVEFNF